MSQENIWITVGFVGQALFFSRFLVQWIASERQGRSVVPRAFWFLSMGGGMVLFAYALFRQDIVFILGQSVGIFVYSRNLWLIYKSTDSGEGVGKGSDRETSADAKM